MPPISRNEYRVSRMLHTHVHAVDPALSLPWEKVEEVVDRLIVVAFPHDLSGFGNWAGSSWWEQQPEFVALNHCVPGAGV